MAKIKVNLSNGSAQEKPLISAFTVNDNSYVILDNELNGSMGLPIILISKISNDKLLKIEDQNEWQNVKEQLKNIIAGHKLQFIKVNEEFNGDDVFFNQLTLPVASFDLLKSNYVVENNDTPVVDAIPVAPEVTEEITPEVSPEVAPAPVQDIPAVDINPVVPEVAPVEDIPTTPVEVEPVVSAPAIDIQIPETTDVSNEVPAVDIEIPNVPNIEMSTEEVNTEVEVPQTEPIITPTPVIDTDVVPVVTEDVFKEQKEAFLQACENMFDALVQKFERELEERK